MNAMHRKSNHLCGVSSEQPAAMASNTNSRASGGAKVQLSSLSASDESEGAGASIPGASLNLINSIAGAAIVAIPHAVQQCGLCLGIFLDCALRAGELNLEDLAGHFFGPRGIIINACITSVTNSSTVNSETFVFCVCDCRIYACCCGDVTVCFWLHGGVYGRRG